MDFVGRTIDVFRSLPDIVVDPRNLGLAHPVGPHDPGAKPLRMVDHDMKRRPLDGNARSLKPDTQLCENFVNEALIARAACKPVHDVAVRMRRGGPDVWRRVHFVAPQSDLDRRRRTCLFPPASGLRMQPALSLPHLWRPWLPRCRVAGTVI